MHGSFLPLFGSGAAPLFPDFSVHKGWFVFFIQKNRFIYYGKEHFDTNFCFFITFLRPLHILAKVSLLFLFLGRAFVSFTSFVVPHINRRGIST
ncbi:hypothetical protein BREVNS_1337 [Brevinematales bacterium NS]|nr:hypothetical protein BREVNS_1337 [Brevinematales bacterium NS]